MSKVILDRDGIKRTLRRMSHEIVENIADIDEVIIIGIKSRGEILAQRLVNNIKELEDVDVAFSTLDITHFRDDNQSKSRVSVDSSGLDKDVSDAIVIIVDDVLYTGRTIRAAMDAITLKGRPRMIKLAVLVDRGHRELPIRPDFVGKNIPTSLDEIVNVFVDEKDQKEYIEIN